MYAIRSYYDWRFKFYQSTRAAEAALACKKLYRIYDYWRLRFFLKIERIRKKNPTAKPANSTPYQPKVEVMT